MQLCHWLEPLLPVEALYLHHDGFMMWHKGRKNDFIHRSGEFTPGMEQFLAANPGAALLSLRCADLPSALESATVWEDQVVKAQQLKMHHISWVFAGEDELCTFCFE